MDGWLKPLQDWLLAQLRSLWDALEELAGDMFLFWLKQMLAVNLWVLSHLPIPDFIKDYTICALLQAAGPTVGWALNTFQIPLGLSFIAAGYVFRLLRKLITLFQW